ncbi:MAG: XdhC family protein [Anaerolineae bacterium]|jgi:xanthine dehydrogenase accessory factor|nr:XdhC family protein [Anaerolineae bacterium]MBT7191145.1 XdhC family protein [Anaerolineae bacterium]MBT7988303.1 XdhC family protein [Anaerolineae bacterium]
MKTIYQALAEIEETNQIAALATIVRSKGSTPRHGTSKMLIYADGNIIGTVGGGELERRVHVAAQEAMQDGEARYLTYNMSDPSKGDPGICGGTVEVFVEPILPNPTLLLIGAGHVGKAVAYLAKWLDFHVVVAEDRAEFCTPEHIPGGDEYLPVAMDEITEHLKINSQTYIVMATRGADVDAVALPDLLESDAAYIGVIGSKRRWLAAASLLQERGIPEEKYAKVHSPIGLEIEAETPEEIAVSIMAEVLMIRNGGTGEKMST